MSMLDRIRTLATEQGLTFSALEKRCGLGNGTIKRWGDQSPSINKVQKLANTLNVSLDYLVYGTQAETVITPGAMDLLSIYQGLDNAGQEMVKAVTLFAHSRPLVQTVKRRDVDPIPTPKRREADRILRPFVVYDMPASAGWGQFLDSEAYTIMNFPASDIPLDATFGVRIDGDSMTPKIRGGDIALVKQQPTIEEGEVGIFLLRGDCFCKRYEMSDGHPTLISNNPEYEPIEITAADEVRVIGKVVGVLEV